MAQLADTFAELIRRAATDLPKDVCERLVRAAGEEKPGSNAHAALELIRRNIDLARKESAPICQDTGTNTWFVYVRDGTKTGEITKAIRRATTIATRNCWLRPNAVDPVTGVNSGDNLGIGHPVIHYRTWTRTGIHADLLLKGGGCENVNAQYALPEVRLGAGRDWAGIRAVVLDAIHRAQGRGCAPGVVGVAIGGDRGGGYAAAKEQLLRRLDDGNPDPVLRSLENEFVSAANRLGVGPMGFGGRATLLGAKVTKLHRLPASYFVSVSYSCWACRRASVTIAGRTVRFSQVSEVARKYR